MTNETASLDRSNEEKSDRAMHIILQYLFCVLPREFPSGRFAFLSQGFSLLHCSIAARFSFDNITTTCNTDDAALALVALHASYSVSNDTTRGNGGTGERENGIGKGRRTGGPCLR